MDKNEEINYLRLRGDLLAGTCGVDAAKWTDAFLQHFPEGTNDWGTMLGWFANAIEQGRNE